MAELTVGTALFLIMILLPGYVSLWASGKVTDAPEAFKDALYRGASVFAFVLFLALAAEMVLGRDFPAATTLLQLLGGRYQAVPGSFAAWLAGYLVLFYATAVAVGLTELWLGVRAVRCLKAQIRLRNWPARGTPFEVSSREDALLYLFLYYRLCGRRPFVTLRLADEPDPLQGEVIKVAWGPQGGLLVVGADDPRDATWIPLARLSSIRFDNVRGEEDILPRWLREWLDLVHPGLAGEAEQKLLRERLEPFRDSQGTEKIQSRAERRLPSLLRGRPTKRSWSGLTGSLPRCRSRFFFLFL